MGEDLEKTLLQFCDSLQDCLQWHEITWVPLQQELEDLGFQWEKFMAEQPVSVSPWGELARIERSVKVSLLPVLAARSSLYKWMQLEKQLRELAVRLELAARSFDSSRVIVQLASAVTRREAEDYRNAYARLLELQNRQSDLSLRRTLLGKMESAAPAWAAAIRNRKGIHGRREVPGDASSAWLWRQISDELDRRAGVALESLQTNSERLREQLQRVTVELIDRRAWAFQARRTSSHQRQSLVGWLDTIRRIGKGHGVRVPLLRAEAARKMSECRGAVPVWIMPLSRVVENFDPRMTRFDVVIVDEASQSDVMALVALYLGKTVLVVGDHEQVSPSAVGQDLGIIQNLIFQYLQGIPNSDLYDGQISIYDLARQSFGGATCLVEHFRCVPEIVQFSNMISYDGRIKPLRDPSRVELRPHTIVHQVDGSSRDGKVNRREALEVASLIAAAIEQPEYQTNAAGAPVSFGAVSLVGDEQAIEIESLLRTHLLPEQYERHHLLCGNAAQFQGDERDVVFVSLVDTAGRGPLPLRDQQMFKQRFNVAASRARDQMWIVHSLDPGRDLKAGDLRRQLIEHAQDPIRLMLALEEKEKRAPSQLELAVMKRLRSAGYRVTPQWRVGAYRIDIVVEGGRKRLAIECDGDRYRPLEKLTEDMERQAVLERVGWTFTRIRCTEFLRDPAKAMKPVLEKLRLLEIPMEAGLPESEPQPPSSRELTARVIRRAAALRKSWAKLEPSAENQIPAEVESLAG
jgi:very-short-patch-repair endonuclease